MSWKLTIDVIFNSFPLIKNKNLILFLCHCERSVVIQWLQICHCERSVVILGLQTRHCKQSVVIQWLQSCHCERSVAIQRLQTRHCKWSNDFKGAVEKKSRESKVSRGLRTFWCKDWWCCGVNELFNASIGSFKGSMDKKMLELKEIRGKWSFLCENRWFLRVNDHLVLISGRLLD